MKNLIIVLYALVFTFPYKLIGQEKIDYLVSFAKAYGYVKYFHPSTESTVVDWDKFSVYGAEQVLKCNSEKQFDETMNTLFRPIGPSVKFIRDLNDFNFKEISPQKINEYELTYWQHLGVSKDMQYSGYAYKSILVNQIHKINDTTEVIGEAIFEKYPKFGELIEKKIGANLYCQIPLTLYVKEGISYPISQDIDSLRTFVERASDDPSNISVRLGNVINLYNVIQHFYPYFEEVEVNWEKELEVALKRCFSDKSSDDHLITLQKFTAPIRDGHLWIWQGKSPYEYYPDIGWEWIQDALVITGVLNDSLGINVGDVVSKINNQPAKAYFQEVNSRISYGTTSYLNYTNKTRSLSAKKGTKLELEINNKTFTLEHHRSSGDYKCERIAIQDYLYKEIREDIMYINLGDIPSDTLSKLLPRLSKMKGIIGDFRGHNYRVWDFLAHLTLQEIPAGFHVKIPKYIYPDQEQQVGFEDSESPYEPKAPYLGDINVVFIIDGRTKSSSESFISTVKHSNLATIVGEQTAGANGMINPFKLLGDFTIWWTGAKVVNPDGSQFHCIGITPDIPVEVTIDGIKEKRDEFLEKAIEIIEN